VLDWACDDQPFRLHEDKGGLLAVPYSFEINDLPLFLRTGCDGEAFARAIRNACDQLLADAEGAARVLPICIHPFVVGQPARFKPFADTLAAIVGRDDIWLTTSDEIAAVFAAQEQQPPSI
jgi:allantoinase